ncbi:MAG: hypothetical protein LW832_07885, partial [Parachlamydia sp.]|jgi:hypothetical protein|nr:hypothetical protein [Parachlamydia sp.]
VVADAAFYYQTSMGPQFVLAGIPAVQIGHAVYNDVLVRSGLAKTATNREELEKALRSLGSEEIMDQCILREKLGISKNWRGNLQGAVVDLALHVVGK